MNFLSVPLAAASIDEGSTEAGASHLVPIPPQSPAVESALLDAALFELSANSEIQHLQKQVRILQKKLERSELERANLESNVQKKEVSLRQVIHQLESYQEILENKQQDLALAFDELTLMHDKLVEADKMAALGSLVAGVAHEINTPVGTSITVASTLMEVTQSLEAMVTSGQLKRSALNEYLEIAQTSAQLLLSNLNRAGELVQSFKQVAVDQSTAGQREFVIKHYLEEVVMSLSPQFKKTNQQISVIGDDAISIVSYPGILAQVATNLVTNSLTHAFNPEQTGHLQFQVQRVSGRVVIEYRDDGSGIPADIVGRIFEPFFTTARHKGGTGLGLHITYNLVCQKLGGSIEVQSQVGLGTKFTITLPCSITN
jgi:signal transduction histidine kinase